MKITITDITFEDLEPVMADIISGSQFLSVNYKEEDLPESMRGNCMCFEDACTYVLKSGKPIIVTDWYCEGENNSIIRMGTKVIEKDNRSLAFGLPPEESINMQYEITLDDILKAANDPNNSELMKSLLITEDFDLETTDCFLQVVTLGDVIYG